MHFPAAICLPLFALLAGASAGAQMLNNPVQDYINKSTLLNNILSNARATAMSQQAQTGSTPSGQAAASSSPAADPTRFSPAGGSLLPKMLAAATSASPAEREQAEQLFISLIQMYEQTATKDGFPAADLAYAFNYFVVNTYMVVHDLHDVPYEKDPRVRRGKDMFDRLTIIHQKKALAVTIDHEHAVYSQLKATLAQNAAVRRMTDRQKQELTELLAILYGMNHNLYLKGIGAEDERLIDQARQMAKTYLEKITGSPVERIKIAAGGLQF